MKKNILHSIGAAFAISALTLSFNSCASDDPFNTDGTTTAGGNDPYLAVTLIMPQDESSSRGTDYDGEYDTTEKYERGSSFEYSIKTLHLYFFKFDNTSSKWKIVKFGNDYYKDVKLGAASHSSTNENEYGEQLDDIFGAKYSSASNIQVPAGTYRVFALCNDSNSEFEDDDITYMDDFLNATHTLHEKDSQTVYTNFNDNGLPMSSRTWDGEVFKEITLTKDNTSTSPKQVTIYVERNQARIRYMNMTTTFTLYDINSPSTSVGSVTLKNKELVNFPAHWYVFRHVGNITSVATTPYTVNFYTGSTTDEGRTLMNAHGPICSNALYVITPATKDQNTSGNFAENDAPLIVNPVQSYYYNTKGHRSVFDWSPMDGLSASTSSSYNVLGYVNENVMHADAQRKGNTTAVIFAAELNPTTVKYYNTTYGSWTTKSSYSCTDLFYYDNKFFADLYSATYWAKNSLKDSKFTSITTVEESTKTTYDSYSTSISYNTCESKYGVKRFINHIGYYIYYIKHVDNKIDGTMGRMEYSVVRNNSYDITINKIYSPALTEYGVKNIDPSEPVETEEDDTPTTTNAYISATVVVRPWITRPQTTDLKE